MPKNKKPLKRKAVIKKTNKKTVRKTSSINKSAEGKMVGRITHYFSNINVAVVKLTASVKNGDMVRIVGGKETDFEQKVSSMQIDRAEVKSAKKGASVGIKIDQKVHEGYKVYKI